MGWCGALRRHHHSPTVAMQPAGQGSRGARHARNGHTTALFAYECQSFPGNVIAGLGQIGAWDDPRGADFRAQIGGELRESEKRISPLLEKWRRRTPHDTPPYPFTPSPTFAHSSNPNHRMSILSIR